MRVITIVYTFSETYDVHTGVRVSVSVAAQKYSGVTFLHVLRIRRHDSCIVAVPHARVYETTRTARELTITFALATQFLFASPPETCLLYVGNNSPPVGHLIVDTYMFGSRNANNLVRE